jgi:phage terminase large subunit-like protein
VSLQSLAEIVARHPDREALLAGIDPLALEFDWRFWARPNQVAPEGDWRTWLALAGRGFGKTEAGAQWIRERVNAGARSIALIAETQKDLEEVMVARLLKISPPDKMPRVRYKPVRVIWPNGAMALGYNGSEPNQLRGPEFDTAWVDELAKYRYAQDTWDMLQFTMRSGTDPRVFVTTTPRPIAVLREIIADATTVVTRGSTMDNAANLPADFLKSIVEKYGGTRLGRQELNAEMLDDVPGALWTRAIIEDCRLKAAPELRRVVIAVDPSGTSGKDTDGEGDDIGIIAAGLGIDGRGYVLEDYSCNLSPEGWARRVSEAYSAHDADRVVAERNFGGAMVEAVLRASNKSLPVKVVTASRGKIARAEPIAALYEQGRVSHIGALPALEDQMCGMTPSGYVGSSKSPDRADALVWALSELMLGAGYDYAGAAARGL